MKAKVRQGQSEAKKVLWWRRRKLFKAKVKWKLERKRHSEAKRKPKRMKLRIGIKSES